MVNGPSQILHGEPTSERRERTRVSAEHAPALGAVNLNPFGDLHGVQHLTVRLAKSLKPVFEPLIGEGLRVWAEPLVVQRYGDYRAERPAGLTGWLPLAMTPGRGRAIVVIDGKLTFEMLDRMFGGDGEAPDPLPVEFTGSAETLLNRVADMFATRLSPAWEMLADIEFIPATFAMPMSIAPGLDAGDAMVVTRIGTAQDDKKPQWIDILYPVSALKPFSAALTAKVIGGEPEAEPQWRSDLTRAALGVGLKVRSVLAEPVVPASVLMGLKPGDIIPITFGQEVPVMVGDRQIGSGTAGTANGRAAIRLTRLNTQTLEDVE